jgi:tetratricopeptide (TPR) repeat protein
LRSISMAKWHVHCTLFLIAGGIIVQTAPLPALSQAVNSADQATTAKAQKLLNGGQFDNALKALDALAVHQAEPGGTERLRGMAFYGMGQLQSSEQAFEKALIQDPADREAIQMEGVALFRLADPPMPFLSSRGLAFLYPAAISIATMSWASAISIPVGMTMRAAPLRRSINFRPTPHQRICSRRG